MKRNFFITLILLICGIAVVTSAAAQEGRTVQNIGLSDLHGRSVHLPQFGTKNLIVFYVDPDRVGQNDEFVREIKECATLRNGKFAGVNILNVKAAPNAPNAVAYKMAQKRAEASGTPFLIDPNGILSDEWRLGDCDNYSTILIVDVSGKIKFLSKGKITDYNKARFYSVIEAL